MDEAELAEELLRRFDPDGNFRKYEQEVAFLTRSNLGRWLVESAGLDPSEVQDVFDGMRNLAVETAELIIRLTPLGWAFSGRTPHDAARDAVRLIMAGQDGDSIDRVLVDAWNRPGTLEGCEGWVAGLALVDPVRMETHRSRARLVREAVLLHREGRFVASVPIALAQIDGVVLDATNGRSGFFVRRNPSLLTDTTTVAGTGGFLGVLQGIFNAPQDVTESSGRTSRHGIMHGRELGYDTVVNSTKCLALLLAVTEWARGYLKQQP